MINSLNFNDYSNYYDLLYKDKNYLKEVNYINKLLKTFYSKKKLNILEWKQGFQIFLNQKKSWYTLENIKPHNKNLNNNRNQEKDNSKNRDILEFI